jgi:hypothetical protein
VSVLPSGSLLPLPFRVICISAAATFWSGPAFEIGVVLPFIPFVPSEPLLHALIKIEAKKTEAANSAVHFDLIRTSFRS